MKKLFVMILLLPLFSCNDWLNVESEKSVTFLNFFKSEQDLQSTLISMFGYEKNLCVCGINMRTFNWTGLQCDELGQNEGFRELSVGTFINAPVPERWVTQYNAIYLANMLEDNRFRFEGVSEERADYWIAQANFVKAFMYFDLVQNWGEAPLAPGTESIEAVGKSSADILLNEAIRCAEIALSLPTHEQLTDAYGNSVTSRQYASLGTVHTLLANIYAWMGGLYGKDEYWRKAEEHASLVIDNKVGAYDLEETIGDMLDRTLGPGRNSVETIFSIAINEQDQDRFWVTSLEFYYPGFALVNFPYGAVSAEDIDYDSDLPKITVETVYQIFPDEDDARLQLYWHDLGNVISYWEYTDWDDDWNPIDSVAVYSTYAFIDKWNKPIYSTNPFVTQDGKMHLLGMECDRVVWRLADLILLRAECRTRLKMPTAVDDLNRIRKRAGLKDYAGSTDPEILRKEIFHERERELFGEGQRYFDIVRNGYYREELSFEYAALTENDVKNGALYLPVAKMSFEKNTLMKQNTYWIWRQQ